MAETVEMVESNEQHTYRCKDCKKHSIFGSMKHYGFCEVRGELVISEGENCDDGFIKKEK